MTFHRPLAVAVIIVLLSGASTNAAETDLQRIQGTWAVVSRTINGKPLPIFGRERMIFQGDRIIQMGTEALPADQAIHFELDATAAPKHFDFVSKIKNGERIVDVPLPGIYKWDGDNLWIGTGLPNQPRPSAFDAKSGAPTTVMVLKREAEPDAEENEAEKLREWVDNTGKFRFRAELVEVDGEFAVLKGTDGKMRRIPISRLSEKDQHFLRGR